MWGCMENIRLKKRLKKKNTKDRKVFYWPRAVSHHKNLDPGTQVICLEDAYGNKPKLVKIARLQDYVSSSRHGGHGPREYETFIVFLEDLTA